MSKSQTQFSSTQVQMGVGGEWGDKIEKSFSWLLGQSGRISFVYPPDSTWLAFTYSLLSCCEWVVTTFCTSLEVQCQETMLKLICEHLSLYVPYWSATWQHVSQNYLEMNNYSQGLIHCNTYAGINIGPTFINFGGFSRPYSLIKGPTLIKF